MLKKVISSMTKKKLDFGYDIVVNINIENDVDL